MGNDDESRNENIVTSKLEDAIEADEIFNFNGR